MLDRATQAQQDDFEDGEPTEEPLVELGFEDEEGNDIEGTSDDGWDAVDDDIYDGASE